MAYLCVDKDGQECICQNEPERWGDIRVEDKFGSLDKVDGKRYTKRMCNDRAELIRAWVTYWRDMEIINMYDHINYRIDLPTGTIVRILGRVLTWDDEPVKLK
jgi:hypothetical protein